MRNVPNCQLGYTLVELIITITIIAVIAAIAVPAFSTAPDKKVQLAAEEFAVAIRFARSESLRTGEPHGIHEQSSDKRIRVFRLDTSVSPATLMYDIYHPISKSLYDVDIDTQSLAAVDSITRVTNYRGTCNNVNQVYFDTNGTPWCSNPTTALLDSYELTFQSDTALFTVALDAVTGRVTIR